MEQTQTAEIENEKPKFERMIATDVVLMKRVWDNVNEPLLNSLIEIKNQQ